jgi:undecaprenyl-diphosphatase
MSSFPSGHTMMFFSIIPIMSKNFPKTKILFWTLAVLIGLSRIYLGVHYFSDVIAGALIGYGIGWICIKMGEKYAWKY